MRSVSSLDEAPVAAALRLELLDQELVAARRLLQDVGLGIGAPADRRRPAGRKPPDV
jgi:hypothetical protein